ncbi:MAG TPA: Asp-tRNA(Asn)/Glu-tRNA(Gln) amidotransferase subunit GatB [Candidatus Hydrogenedentes bacterium]|nr:Asp-tRNA(Asn)/Glu-tRNA(Gln) amidotransferase subunit GatB [Candidatus Hydrogenedentota bacterium]NLT62490.1 Asp-tRNA(Asn)/Glu-tRNA(Gln) amidotransferase subunit GatB [Candidatus Hydrogenedentota bacterium]HNV21389.1 Asp-tRNA(Asn)/Glu-tRNA(Gln) amidotransferase subunit GatB [Candidatus Hydrogenedentota bacterium]HNZ20413.1 Asp-tRNA(Asn)/Glu-tRNA(Gln) amidotransferase subunit GatB [Candidatus Hydrogenedentota bacterium]HOH35912.1 Asp-tRNA(Asn)/Glu-tRNA(Gln) amidotransferase subunit GatB [Candi
MEYDAVIGMEVHVELSTASKVFCSCSTQFNAPANTNVCPVCLGMPGVLPVMNRKAVEYSVAAGLALNCTISRWSKMDRKNYFYPDLAKNYQISQYDLPLCHGGWIDIRVGGVTKRIGITRAHLEEDTARNTHTLSGGVSGIDFNRSGVALLEIVTEPDISSADEAFAYLTELKRILQYLEVSDCNMEEGSLRAEANVSLRPRGSAGFGTKTEVKNVASFSGVHKAIDYEIARQRQILDSGGTVVQETRGWDADRGITVSQRTKESAHDYRYFPEPDLVPLAVDEAWEARIRASLPELPQARWRRFQEAYGLSPYDAEVLTASRAMADYFEATVAAGAGAKPAANWIMGDLQALLVKNGLPVEECKVASGELAAMIRLIDDGTISGKIAKDILLEMFDTGQSPTSIVEAKGLIQISDESELERIVAEVVAGNPGPVEDFRNGKEKALGFLVGQAMKASRGKANPKMINEMLLKALEN